MLQWLDPETGRRNSMSTITDDEEDAEQQRDDLEYELNYGKYQEASKLDWEAFRQLFEEDYLGGGTPPADATQLDAGRDGLLRPHR